MRLKPTYHPTPIRKSLQQGNLSSTRTNFGLNNTLQHKRFTSFSQRELVSPKQNTVLYSKNKTIHSSYNLWSQYKNFFHSSSVRLGNTEKEADVLKDDTNKEETSPETKEKTNKISEILIEAHKADMSGIFDSAAEKYQQGLTLLEEISGSDSDAVGQISHSLGIVYMRMGRYDEAQKLILRSIEISKQNVGPAHTLTVQRQLSYCRLLMETGDAHAAEELLQSLCRDVAGPEQGEQFVSFISNPSSPPPDNEASIERKEELGNVLFNYGLLKSKTGKPKKAARIFTRTMMLWELETKGKENHRLVSSMAILHKELGKAYAESGMVPQAKANLLKAMELLEEHCPDDSFELLDTLNNRISIEMNQKDYDAAEKFCRKCINIFEREGISFYPQDYASQLHMLGTILYEKGLYTTFDRPMRKAIEVKRHLLGENHPNLANSHNQLGLLALHAAREELAESNFKESVRIYRQELPYHESADDKDTAATAVQLYSQILAGKGQEKEAKEVLELLSKMVFVLHLKEHQDKMENPEQVMDRLLNEMPQETGHKKIDEHQEKVQTMYNQLLELQKNQMEQDYGPNSETNESLQENETNDNHEMNQNPSESNQNNSNVEDQQQGIKDHDPSNVAQESSTSKDTHQESSSNEKPKTFKQKPKKKINK